MDSQADSLDIPKLKRFALGLPESDVSQPFLSEPDSQSSSLIPERQTPGKESAIHQAVSCSASSASLLTVHVFPASNRHVQVASQSDTRPQPVLNSFSHSNHSKMSSGDTGPGDTQPISQSVYEGIMSRSKLLSMSQEGSHNGIDMHDADQGTFMTFKEGDPGHTDLLAGFGDSNPSETHENSDNDPSSPKPDDSSPVYTFRDSQQFMTTPLTVEKLQNGRSVASATPCLPRNPLATDLGSSGSLMALSQVFKATQAPSSPFVNGLPSGPLSDRPSPNIPIQARPMQKYTSSPLRTPRSALHRTHTDPHRYISMDESQKQRNKIIEERRTRSVEDMNSDQSDDEFDKESSFVRRLRLQKKIEQETHARLAAVGRNSPRKAVPGSSISWTKTASQEPTSPVDGDTQPLASNEGISEEETEQEDNAVAPNSQHRQHISSSEEDKENFIGPSVDDMHTTTSAHDRLSQALHLSRSLSPVHSSSAEKEASVTRNNLAISEQIINVRDSQPSPSQGGIEIEQNTRSYSHHELDEVHSSPDDMEPPAKRPRLQQDTDHVPVKQSPQRRSNSPSSIHSATRSSQHNANSSAPIPSTNTINTTEKPSSMPSLVTNTPINRVDNTVPETSIPESSPNGSRQESRPVGTTNIFPPIAEAEQEDDDLPTPHHRRDWNKFRPSPSPSGTPRTLKNPAFRQNRLFVSSSPKAGKIKSLSEISAEHSPVAHPDGDMNVEVMSASDKEFSNIVDAFDHQTPTKKRRTSPKSTPLRSELSHSTMPKFDFNKATDEPAHQENSKTPGSPEQTYKPAIRRRRGRPPQGKNMYDMEEMPPAMPKLPKQHSTGKQASTTKSQWSISVTIPIKSQSSQASFATENSAPGRIERQSRETSVATTAYPRTESEAATPKPRTPLPEEKIIAPNQVLAAWNGLTRSYYPARFLRAVGHQRCILKFTDSEPTDVALGSVKKLQLHIGDSVKVDLPGFPKIIHVIQGFSGQLSADELTTADANGSLPVTDIYGRSTLILVPKNRKSPRRGHLESDQTVEVPMHSIYLDMNLWNQLKDRAFTIKSELIPKQTQTPTRGISTPVSPGSKLPRNNLLMQKGLFAGMVFAVSYGKQDEVKNKITDLISKNGGHILQDGFEELFDFPSSVPHAAPSKISARDESDDDDDEVQFGLASGCEEIGFACLIADKHSRRAKYMQALALNVPCLSGRWVEDCVRENHILDWSCYLLPAGESKFLDGATKSRILTPTPAEQAKFSETIVGRPKILEGQSVLLVMGGGRKAEERRQAYIFLTYALGAARVERVFDLKAGKAALDAQKKDGGWDWLYVDDGEEAAATKMVLGRGKGGSVAGQKRKRSSSLFNKSACDKQVRIVSNDFVCQSLILGKIYEP
ncbi:Tumor suppressor p53-binding protein 1 [Talaromyces islandicus]|uniref:Tumor suppressor p53-binding protein 1 n=1 Tax=Talaromyces islandicus TaxID=28573 RepID=A0A0U1LVM9_TALIS|nr:Tumor suppressor p53-binding protein 1 [Talaromyces islandicus]